MSKRTPRSSVLICPSRRAGECCIWWSTLASARTGTTHRNLLQQYGGRVPHLSSPACATTGYTWSSWLVSVNASVSGDHLNCPLALQLMPQISKWIFLTYSLNAFQTAIFFCVSREARLHMNPPRWESKFPFLAFWDPCRSPHWFSSPCIQRAYLFSIDLRAKVLVVGNQLLTLTGGAPVWWDCSLCVSPPWVSCFLFFCVFLYKTMTLTILLVLSCLLSFVLENYSFSCQICFRG